MRIGVNFSYKLIASRGIARFIENILQNYPTSDNDEFYFFLPHGVDLNLHLMINTKYIFIQTNNFFIFEHIFIPKFVKKYRIDVLLNPANTAPFLKNTKWVSVIHDVIPFKLNTKFLSKKWLVNIYMRCIMKNVIRKSDKLVTVSNYSKNDIMSLNISNTEISVVYNGFNHVTIKKSSVFVSNLDIPNEYYFWLGGDGYNKNLDLIIKLLERGNINKKLCVVGVKKQENVDKLTQLGACVFVNISDQDLEMLYRNAKVFIFPSFYEGFGIPILEALNYRVPYIIASNTTSIPEVCGDACFYADPTSIDNFEEKIILAFNNELESKTHLYVNQLNKFKWEQEAKKVEEIISKLRNK